MRQFLLCFLFELYFSSTFRYIFAHFIFLTLTLDKKEVELEEDNLHKKMGEPNQVQNITFSVPNPSSSQWANKTNTHKTNLNNSNMTNDENCLELPMNSEYHNAEKDLVGGKIANYNRSSGMLMDDLHTEAFSFKNKPSNESSINGINCNSTHNQINQRLEGNSSTPKYMFFCN